MGGVYIGRVHKCESGIKYINLKQQKHTNHTQANFPYNDMKQTQVERIEDF